MGGCTGNGFRLPGFCGCSASSTGVFVGCSSMGHLWGDPVLVVFPAGVSAG